MAPKTSRAVWDKLKLEFESGTYSSLNELAIKYSVNPVNLRGKIFRDKWTLKRQTLENKIEQKVEEAKINQVEQYLKKSIKRNERYEELIDASIGQLAVNQEGKPLVEPSDIGEYTKAEQRIQAMTFAALRIPAASQVDVTSKGQSFSESIVSAISTLRESFKATPPKQALTSEMVDRLLECDVVKEVKDV